MILQSEIDCRLAGLFDEAPNIPKANLTAYHRLASKSITDGFIAPSKLIYRNYEVSFDSVNVDGFVIVRDQKNQLLLCDEGESLKWEF
jgi:hypothetical protein